MTSPSPTLCIGVLTQNEEKRIAQCLRSAAFAQQIVVVDSGSSDDTCQIARDLGAEVYVYDQWEGFAVQRNRLLQHCQCDYVFFLDADEEITPELQAEIEQAVRSGLDCKWEVQWLQVAYGRLLTRMKPNNGLARMFYTASIDRFEGLVHEYAVMHRGGRPTRKFKSRLVHYSREDINGSILKLAQYSQLRATQKATAGKRGGIRRGLGSGLTMFIRLYFLKEAFCAVRKAFFSAYLLVLSTFFNTCTSNMTKKAFNK